MGGEFFENLATKYFPLSQLNDETLESFDTVATCKGQQWQVGLKKGRRKRVKILKTSHIYFSVPSLLLQKKKKKGIPLFLVLRRGYVRQDGRRDIPETSELCQSLSRPFILSSTLWPISSVQWVPVWGPGSAAAWWGGTWGGERPWGASPSTAPAGWAPQARS